MFASTSLVAADLDGTLLRGADQRILGDIQRLQLGLLRTRGGHPGVRVTYATGRAATWVAQLQARAEFNIPRGTPLVLYNGSVVMESGSHVVIRRECIPSHALSAVRALVLSAGGTVLAYEGPDGLFDGGFQREVVLGWACSGCERPDTDINGAEISWDRTEFSEFRPVAILVSLPEDAGRRQAVLTGLSQMSEVSTTSSGQAFIEIRPKGANKASALAFVVGRMALGRHAVLAIGDGDNDVEMLRWAGIGVAVAGASPSALAASAFVAHHGAGGAMIEVLRVLKYARRYFPPDALGGGL